MIDDPAPVALAGGGPGRRRVGRAGRRQPPSEQEMLRVLHPGGVCVASGRTHREARTPAGVDEWRHPYHEPDNNVVSQDRVARLPGELRFQTHPVFAPMPNQTLFAGGRIFFFSGHIAFHEREEPLLNTLTVLNAYNGLRLWSRPLDPRVRRPQRRQAGDRRARWSLPRARPSGCSTRRPARSAASSAFPPEAAAAGDTDWKWIAQEKDGLWAAFGPAGRPRRSPQAETARWATGPGNVADEQYRGIDRQLRCRQNAGGLSVSRNEAAVERRRAGAVRRPGLVHGGRADLPVVAAEVRGGSRLGHGRAVVAQHARDDSKELFDAIGSSLKRQGWGLGWATYCSARANNDVVCIAGPPFKKTIGIGFAKGDLLWASTRESPHPFFLQRHPLRHAAGGVYPRPPAGRWIRSPARSSMNSAWA